MEGLGVNKITRIMIVEDEKDTADEIAAAVTKAGWQAVVVYNGTDALKCIKDGFNAIILDRMLPDMDGIAVLQSIRAEGNYTPILILSSLGHLRHRIDGLDEGADDYLPKPFSTEELVARLRTLMRRESRKATDDWVSVGGFLIHKEAKTVHFQGTFIRMSTQEFSFLNILCENPNEIVSRELIWQAAWPAYNNLPHRQNVMDVGASRLRKKLEDTIGFDPIVSVRGVGFMLKVAEI